MGDLWHFRSGAAACCHDLPNRTRPHEAAARTAPKHGLPDPAAWRRLNSVLIGVL